MVKWRLLKLLASCVYYNTLFVIITEIKKTIKIIMELKIAYLLINSNLNWQSIMISHNIHINQIISLTTIILDLIFLLDWRTLTLQLHENIMKSISYFLIKCYFTLSLFFVLLDLIIIRVGLIRIQGRSWAYYHHHSSLTYLPQICTYMSATC